MDTSCSERSNHGRPGAWDPLMSTCCALRAFGAVKEPIRKTSERTALVPSDTANTTMISQISSRCSRSGSGCGETQAGAAGTDSLRAERMLTSAFAEHLVVQVNQEIPVQRLQLR